jgi:phosphoribosyl-AMP cyclohydrolase
METINAFQVALWLHYFISVGFLVIAVWLSIRSVRGILKGLPYLKLDKILAYLFIIDLYLQLLFGFILFSNLSQSIGYDYQSADGSLAMVSKRLWPIEHIVLMLFALFIANLGLIFSNKSSVDKTKHSKILLYYSISILLIAISLASIYLL